MENERSGISSTFHHLGSYLGQDSDLWGNTFDEIITCYKNESTRVEALELLHEIESFQQRFSSDLDEVFLEAYGHDFSPKLRGFTTASFFDALQKNLQ
ncbi:contact-dependent growth inhibition system immunity protein [Burkholderia metallica]|uniref:contact-dependent growth inhibition system immunity protein n=1 Tax=Burkholderia metallica TaxID=488729 RepID=UPI00313315FC